MDFEFPEEIRMLRELVARFVRDELLPHEGTVIRRDAERGFGDAPLLPPEVADAMQQRAKDLGLWGIDVPEEFGGQNLGALAKICVVEKLKHSIVPFVLPPDSPNLYLLQENCRGTQIDRYLLPYSTGEKKSCLALTESAAGSDLGAIKTRAERVNGKWRISGTKIFISNAKSADFMIVAAITDPAAKYGEGVSLFLVDKGSTGLSIPSSFPMIGEYHPYEVHLDAVEVGDDQLLGELNGGFKPLRRRLGIRRAEIAGRCIGLAERCLEMMIEQANSRSTYGTKLADRQAIQWWIADSFAELELVRLGVYRLATRIDAGAPDVARDASLIKVQATEMIMRVVDRAIQLFGGMGVSKELPLEYISRVVRVYRIVEGPSEVHRWAVARDILRNGMPGTWG
jgi:alkylation response protein AidB-like acyl-CoA dehydrogenase